ncbi:MAG TPA: hypothetical protein VKX28_25780 [Xanthobacteraceae bacterium]|nr:hypothetical protein [Xanthobacteraceae bacterium]
MGKPSMKSSIEPSIAYSGVGQSRHGAPKLRALGAALLGLALAHCSSFDAAPPPVNANLYPARYKATVLTFLQTNPYGMVGAISAELSPPVLKPFGTDSRYVACMHAAGPNWRKEKMVVFYGGEINQFVDATEEACKDAAYAPFPELIAMLAQLKAKPK